MSECEIIKRTGKLKEYTFGRVKKNEAFIDLDDNLYLKYDLDSCVLILNSAKEPEISYLGGWRPDTPIKEKLGALVKMEFEKEQLENNFKEK